MTTAATRFAKTNTSCHTDLPPRDLARRDVARRELDPRTLVRLLLAARELGRRCSSRARRASGLAAGSRSRIGGPSFLNSRAKIANIDASRGSVTRRVSAIPSRICCSPAGKVMVHSKSAVNGAAQEAPRRSCQCLTATRKPPGKPPVHAKAPGSVWWSSRSETVNCGTCAAGCWCQRCSRRSPPGRRPD